MLAGLDDTGTQPVEISLIESTQVKLPTPIEGSSGTLSLIRQGIKSNLCRTFIGPCCLLPGPQAHEVVLVLLQKIKIARKVQNRFVATVNQIIVQMNAGKINRLAV